MEGNNARRSTTSAAIITRNEKQNIIKCLKTVSWCDEIIVVDDESTDGTRELAKQKGAKVYFRPSAADFASQRNFALRKAKGKWVLFIDADERVTESLKKEILAVLDRADISGYRLKRDDVFLGKRLHYGETANVKLIRLARKEAGSWTRPVHEIWDIKGRVGELNQPLLHYPHGSIAEFIEEINTYSQIEAGFRKDRGESTTFIELIFFPVGKFIQNYFLRLGILDGFVGFIVAYMMSLHSLLVRLKLIYVR